MNSQLRFLLLLFLLSFVHGQREVLIDSAQELVSATRDAQARDVIVIQTRRLTLSDSLNLTARDVVLRGADGRSVTVTCPEDVPALIVSSANASLENLRFVRCRRAPAVIVQGQVGQLSVNVTLRRVELYDNQLEPSNLTFLLGESDPRTAPLLIRKCPQRQQECDTDVSVRLEECDFARNRADQGGAIMSENANLTIQGCTFTDNEAHLSGGAVAVSGVESSVRVEECRFVGNRVIRGGNVREVTGANGLPLELVTYWTFLFPTGVGGAIDVRSIANFSIHNSTFDSNLAPSGGALAVEVDEENIDRRSRPSLYTIDIDSCQFRANRAAFLGTRRPVYDDLSNDLNLGGAVYVVSNSPETNVSLSESVFEENEAHFGGAVHLVMTIEPFPRIFRCQFNNNRAGESGGAILLRNTGLLNFRESNCTNNFALLGGCMMLTNNAQLEVAGLRGTASERELLDENSDKLSYFANNSAVNGGAIMCAGCRNVILREGQFTENTATSNGGAIYILEAGKPFSIEQSNFTGNMAFKGGAVATEAAGVVTVIGNVGLIGNFSHNKAVAGGAIHSNANNQRENRLEIEEIVFEYNNATTANAFHQEPRIVALMPRIERFRGQRDNGNRLIAAEEATGCGEGGGGALCLVLDDIPQGAVADYLIMRNNITNNAAVVGGGIFAAVQEDDAWNQGSHTTGRCQATRIFDACRGFRFVNMNITENVASAGGGGIFITRPETLELSVNDSLEENRFRSLDRVMRDGRVDSRDRVNATIVDNRVLEGGFGPNGATSVHALWIPEEQRIIRNHSRGERLLPPCPGCAENRTEGIMVYLQDAFGQNITGGIPDAELNVNVRSDDILGQRRYDAERGVININNTEGIRRENNDSQLVIEVVENDRLSAEVEFSTRECFPGEEETETSCNVCQPKEYAFVPTAPGCQRCEENAVCDGGAALVPDNGYWHSTPFSPQFHECIFRDACTFTDRTDKLRAYYDDRSQLNEILAELNRTLDDGETPVFDDYDQCDKGYKGVLCGSCRDGYGHFAGGECVKCPAGRGASALVAIAIAVWMVFFVGTNIFTAFSATHRQIQLAVYKQLSNFQSIQLQNLTMEEATGSCGRDGATAMCTGMDDRVAAMVKLTETMKIFVNYLQVTSVALSINMNWVGLIEGLLSTEMIIIGVTSGSYFVPLDCTLGDDSGSNVPNSIKATWLRVTFPVMLFVFFATVCFVYFVRKRSQAPTAPMHRPRLQKTSEELMNFRSYVIVIIIVVVFFSYINVTSEFMRTVNCIEVDEKRDKDSSDVHQYSRYAIETKHSVWAEDTDLYCFKGDHTLTGVFGILGLICFSFASVMFIITWLPYHVDRLGDPEFVAQYGFIYQGYKEKWYVTYWEAVITLRKALIAAAVVYAFPLGANLQGVCALGVLILAIGLQFLFQPFKSFRGHPNLPSYAGSAFSFLGLNAAKETWLKINNRVSLNALEAGSLLMSIIVFYSGILFNEENTSTAGKYTMAAFTFIVNIAFILYILYRLFFGLHVAVNLHCDHLKSLGTVDSIPEGTGFFCLVRRGVAIFRNRALFQVNRNRLGTVNSNRFDEHFA